MFVAVKECSCWEFTLSLPPFISLCSLQCLFTLNTNDCARQSDARIKKLKKESADATESSLDLFLEIMKTQTGMKEEKNK